MGEVLLAMGEVLCVGQSEGEVKVDSGWFLAPGCNVRSSALMWTVSLVGQPVAPVVL